MFNVLVVVVPATPRILIGEVEAMPNSPPEKLSTLDEWVSNISPASQFITAPDAKNRSEKAVPEAPNAPLSLAEAKTEGVVRDVEKVGASGKTGPEAPLQPPVSPSKSAANSEQASISVSSKMFCEPTEDSKAPTVPVVVRPLVESVKTALEAVRLGITNLPLTSIERAETVEVAKVKGEEVAR